MTLVWHDESNDFSCVPIRRMFADVCKQLSFGKADIRMVENWDSGRIKLCSFEIRWRGGRRWELRGKRRIREYEHQFRFTFTRFECCRYIIRTTNAYDVFQKLPTNTVIGYTLLSCHKVIKSLLQMENGSCVCVCWVHAEMIRTWHQLFEIRSKQFHYISALCLYFGFPSRAALWNSWQNIHHLSLHEEMLYDTFWAAPPFFFSSSLWSFYSAHLSLLCVCVCKFRSL